jgi:hypothetical protein
MVMAAWFDQRERPAERAGQALGIKTNHRRAAPPLGTIRGERSDMACLARLPLPHILIHVTGAAFSPSATSLFHGIVMHPHESIDKAGGEAANGDYPRTGRGADTTEQFGEIVAASSNQLTCNSPFSL